MTIKTKTISPKLDKDKLAPLLQELLTDVSFEMDDNKNIVELCGESQMFDELKLLCIMNAETDRFLVEFANQKSPLICGGLGYRIEKNLFNLDKRTYCIVNENLIGEFICQSTLFPYFAKKTDIYDRYTIGKVIHLYDSYIYLDSSGTRISEAQYNIETNKLDLSKIHSPTVRRTGSNTSLMSNMSGYSTLQRRNSGISMRTPSTRNNPTRQPISRPIKPNPRTTTRGNSSPLPKQNKISCYKLVLIKWM